MHLAAFAASFEDGVTAFRDGRYQKAYALLYPLAERSDPNAQAFIGVMYERGLGVARDYAVALTWYEASSKQGNALGTLYLARMYQRGTGIPENQTLASELFRKAAEVGNAEAQAALGDAYKNGTGVPSDIDQAIKWYKQAAQVGYGPALIALGEIYELGISVTRDKPLAMFWYRRVRNALIFFLSNTLHIDTSNAADVANNTPSPLAANIVVSGRRGLIHEKEWRLSPSPYEVLSSTKIVVDRKCPSEQDLGRQRIVFFEFRSSHFAEIGRQFYCAFLSSPKMKIRKME